MAKLLLRDVTLLTVTSINIEEAHATLVDRCRGIDFGSVKLLSTSPPSALAPGFQHVEIPAIDLAGYSSFMLRELADQVDIADAPSSFRRTGSSSMHRAGRMRSYNTTISAHRGQAYCEQAPGPITWASIAWAMVAFPCAAKGCQATTKLVLEDPQQPRLPEDLIICHHLFDRLSAAGRTFAPVELAAQFAIELPLPVSKPIDKVFGFHGKLHLPAVQRLLARQPSGR